MFGKTLHTHWLLVTRTGFLSFALADFALKPDDENVILEDIRVRYGYLLELTSYEDKLENDQENAPKIIYTTDESMHNHPVLIGETQNGHDLQDIDEESIDLATSKLIIKRVTRSPVYDQDTTDAQYVRYGDIVRLWLLDKSSGGDFITVYEDEIITPGLAENECLALYEKMKSSELRSLWKVVPFSPTSDEDYSETVSPEGNVRLYFYSNWVGYSYATSGVSKEASYRASKYYIKHINQYAYLNNRKISQSSEYKSEKRIASILDSDSKRIVHNYFRLGTVYMYGVYGMDINNNKAFYYMKLAADQGRRFAFYALGKLYWRVEAHEKALEMFEEAALLSVNSVYRELGDIYRAGFPIPYETASFTIPQNQGISFTYYSIGGIFGDATAALKIGEYYEKGHNEDFGVDHNKALQWYEYVSNQLKIPVATSAVGRIKHILANATKDLSEKNELRREAYEAFEKAAMDNPYTKFTVAVYISNGWGGQQPDPVLGFDILLSLVKTGFDTVLHGIPKCYEQDVGVERDLAKASAYQELAA
ncbi:hypothetical protein DFQ28_009556 [Apophysomyces sp. BC1034]|nr:hypothetical protein DFQ28_009556 [Apophysomyces sp. BC1034]